MSPEQQAARDAAISIAEDCANRLRRQAERPSPHASVIVNKGDLVTALNALRTTPPSAAPAITQEQARAAIAALRIAGPYVLHAVGGEHEDCITVTDALAGVPTR